MPITPITPTGPSAPNTLTPDAAGAVAVPNTLTPDAAGAVAVPNTLTPDAAGTVAAPNTLSADAAGTVAAPNTLSADAAGTIAAPISLPSVTAAAFPRSLTPMVDFDFAAKSYAKNGLAVAFDDIFTYTRASSATFTNRRLKKNGGYEYFLDTDYVGDVTNLLKYSEDFTGSDWSSSLSGDGSVSVISNTTLSPNNDMTADTITVNATGLGIAAVVQSLSSTIGNPYSVSAYFKAARPQDVGKTILIRGAASGTYVNVVLSDNWLKSNSTQQASSSSFTLDITHRPSQGSTSGEIQFYIWGAQVTESAKVLPYVKTLDVAVTKTFAETLRTEYDAVTGENLGALIEGASTNMAFWSEEFSPNWSRTDSTIVLNQTTAPDNTVSADLIYPNASGANKQVYRAVTGVPITTYTSSFYVKSAGISWVMLPAASASNGVWFDLINGVIGTETAGTSGSMLNIGNGWFRCSVTSDATTTVAYSYLRMVDSDGVTTVTANGTSGVYIWGAQLEALPFASSYIRTEGAAVSRSADGLSVSPYDVINPSETSFNVVFDSVDPGGYTYVFIHAGAGSTYYRAYFDSGDRLHSALSSQTLSTGVDVFVANKSIKLSGTYDGAAATLYKDNELLVQNASSTPIQINGANSFYLGAVASAGQQNINGHISKFSTYAQALTAQEITLL